MNAVPTTDETVFGDMNGPLVYWGPVTSSPAALLSPAEKALLLKLRTRLEREQSGTLTKAVATLLETPVAVA